MTLRQSLERIPTKDTKFENQGECHCTYTLMEFKPGTRSLKGKESATPLIPCLEFDPGTKIWKVRRVLPHQRGCQNFGPFSQNLAQEFHQESAVGIVQAVLKHLHDSEQSMNTPAGANW